MRAQAVVHQAQLIDEDREPIGGEGVAVVANVQIPILLHGRCHLRAVEQVAPHGIIQLDPLLHLQGCPIINEQDIHPIDGEACDEIPKLPSLVVPENNPPPVLMEDFIEGRGDLVACHERFESVKE